MRDNPGAKLKVGIDNYHDAVAARQRFGYNGRIGHNTTIVDVGDDRFRGTEGVGIKLHDTVIVAYFPSGIVLNSGRYRTVTTKARMNEVLPPYVRVFQEKYDWYVEVTKFPHGMPPWHVPGEKEQRPKVRLDFEDHMMIPVDPETYLPNPMKRPTAKHLRSTAGRRDWGGVELQEAQAVWDRAMSRRPPSDPRAEFLAEASRKPLGPITHADYLKAIRAPLPGAHMPIPKQYGRNPRPEAVLWQLVGDRDVYGEQAGWWLLVTPDGEHEYSGGPWESSNGAILAARQAGIMIVGEYEEVMDDDSAG